MPKSQLRIDLRSLDLLIPRNGSVYAAIAHGILAILSDIPVNREIETEANIFYFQTGSATALADAIKTFLQREIERPTKAELLQRGEQRKLRMCGWVSGCWTRLSLFE